MNIRLNIQKSASNLFEPYKSYFQTDKRGKVISIKITVGTLKEANTVNENLTITEHPLKKTLLFTTYDRQVRISIDCLEKQDKITIALYKQGSKRWTRIGTMDFHQGVPTVMLFVKNWLTKEPSPQTQQLSLF